MLDAITGACFIISVVGTVVYVVGCCCCCCGVVDLRRLLNSRYAATTHSRTIAMLDPTQMPIIAPVDSPPASPPPNWSPEPLDVGDAVVVVGGVAPGTGGVSNSDKSEDCHRI
jgi:hypothetical protein